MKKLYLLIIVLIVAINLIVGLLIFNDLQKITSPEVRTNIEILDYDSEKITLKTTIYVYNSNPFDMSIEDFKIDSFVQNNSPVSQIEIKGGKIPSYENQTFISEDEIRFNGEELTEITNRMTGKIEISLYSIFKKTIPIELYVITTLGDLFKNISIPQFVFELNVANINETGLVFGGSIQIINPNTFDLFISDIDLLILDENDTQVGKVNLSGENLQGLGKLTINTSGNIDFKALNSEILKYKITGMAGVKIGGIYHSIPILSETDIHIPRIEEFLSIDTSLETTISVDFKITLRGLLVTVGLKVYNPTSIPLGAEDLVSSIFRVDNLKETFIVEQEMDSYTISAKKELYLSSNLTVPYSYFILNGNGKIFPDSIKLKVDGNFKVKDVDQKIPFTVNALFDMRIFT